MVWRVGPNFLRNEREHRYGYAGSSSFWYRHTRPLSAIAVSGLVVVLAVVVAFFATLVYAKVDAGRPLRSEVATDTTVAGSEGGAEPDPPGPAEPAQPSPTIASSGVLTNDVISSKLNESVWAVSTRDPVGQVVEGSAFSAGSAGGRSLLITSLSVVRAATREPAPPIQLRQGGRTVEATLWTWQEDRDLALLVTGANSPGLPMAAASATKPGDRVYTLTPGRALTLGIVTGVGADGIDHNIFVDNSLQGAPLVNQRGEVVAVASLAYNPGGRGSTTLFVGVPVALACERVLVCGGGNTAPDSPAATTSTTRR